MVTFPLGFTDVAAEEEDPFLQVSRGRSCFRVEDLLLLADLLREIEP